MTEAQDKRLRKGKCPKRYNGKRCVGPVVRKTNGAGVVVLVCTTCPGSWLP